jgi:hypothetical protein
MSPAGERGKVMKGAWLCIAGLLGMAAIDLSANALFLLPGGKVPATLVSVMSNRAVMPLPEDDNYYQAILSKELIHRWHFIYKREFRMYRNAPNLTWEHDRMTTNSLGRIGPEQSLAKPPHTRRVALLGDSLASGYLIPSEHTFGPKLEEELNHTRPDGPDVHFEVLNFSCPGYVLPQVMDTAIDDVPAYHADVYLVQLGERSVFKQWDAQLIQIIQGKVDPKYDFLRTILREAGVSRRDSVTTLHTKLAPYRLAVVRGSLEELKTFVAGQGATLVLVFIPAVEPGDLSERRLHDPQEAYAGLNIPMVDLSDTFDGITDRQPLLATRDDPSSFDVHLDEHAYDLVVQAFYRKLREQPAAWSAVTGN